MLMCVYVIQLARGKHDEKIYCDTPRRVDRTGLATPYIWLSTHACVDTNARIIAQILVLLIER